MELFERLGFADATVIVAVMSASLRAIGNIFAGPIVIFKGMLFFYFYRAQIYKFEEMHHVDALKIEKCF